MSLPQHYSRLCALHRVAIYLYNRPCKIQWHRPPSSGLSVTANQLQLHWCFLLYTSPRDNASHVLKPCQATSVSLTMPTLSFLQYQPQLITANLKATSKWWHSCAPLRSIPWFFLTALLFRSLEWDSGLGSMLALLNLGQSQMTPNQHNYTEAVFFSCKWRFKTNSLVAPFVAAGYPRAFLRRRSEATPELWAHSQSKQ